jgi:WD40 repeat protein
VPLIPRLQRERTLTTRPGGRILTNTAVWSPDSEWIVFDTRSDPAGELFDGTRIELVHVRSGDCRTLYESRDGACCGVATFHPREPKVAFILGPEQPTADWTYGPSRRRGVVVDLRQPGVAVGLDACDLVPPFTPGALRGGSHVHVWSPDGELVSFTYEDQVLAGLPPGSGDRNQRNVGVTLMNRPVAVPRSHPRNHDGSGFSVLVTRTVNNPRLGSDEISRAFEEAWVGTGGYVRPDGTRQRWALAFQGRVVAEDGNPVDEVFLVELPDELTVGGDGPLEGTPTRRPTPPRGTRQRRLTNTTARKHPGLRGPRHWLRSSPDGTRIGLLMADDQGIIQFWTVSPNGGEPVQVTDNPYPVGSAFTWFPDGSGVALVCDHSVCRVDVATGRTERLSARTDDPTRPRPEACVVAPDGQSIAFVRRLPASAGPNNQICLLELG